MNGSREKAVVIRAAVRLRMAANIVQKLLAVYNLDDTESKQAALMMADFRASAEQLEEYFHIEKVEEKKPTGPPEPTAPKEPTLPKEPTQLETAMKSLRQHPPYTSK